MKSIPLPRKAVREGKQKLKNLPFYMIRILFTSVFMWLLSSVGWAQEKFTDYLLRQKAGKGQVVLHQSARITDLVNGVHAAPVASKPAATPSAKRTETPTRQLQDTLVYADEPTVQTGQRVRANGYRIQVYSGGNSRAAKNEANMMGQRVKSLFLELPVYTHFISPHWICRVGDFRTYEEAHVVFQKMKETNRFPEAVIVKSKIIVYN